MASRSEGGVDHRAVFRSLLQPVALVDKEGRVVDANPPFAEMARTGGGPATLDGCRGRPLWEVAIANVDGDRLAAFVRGLLDGAGLHQAVWPLTELPEAGPARRIHGWVHGDAGGGVAGAVILFEGPGTAVPEGSVAVAVERHEGAEQLRQHNAALREELQERRRLGAETEALQQVRQAVWDMRSPQDIHAVVATVRSALVDLGLPIHDCGINLVHLPMAREPGANRLVRQPGGELLYFRSSDDANDVAARIWRDGQVVYRRDLAADDPYAEGLTQEAFLGHPVRSVVDVPFSHGTVSVTSTEPNTFSDHHLEILQGVAATASEGFRRMADLQLLEHHAHEAEETSLNLAKLAEDLRRSNAELSEFADVASHDLREPLRKIQTFADRLIASTAGRLNERERDYLARLHSAAQRMAEFITDLLTLSQVTTRGRPFDEVDLAQVLADVLDDLEVVVEQSAGQVDVGVLPRVRADRTQMRRLFQNLISNALKFRPPGANPRVRVRSVAATLHGREAVAVRVEDDGIGFDPSDAERVFLAFQRLHGRGDYAGTGIGLAICRRIAERHGGRISASAKPGEGAVFTVVLPLDPM